MDRSRYAELFLTESREHLSAINQSLLELERTGGGAASVSALFRSVHTIKGMSATMGYNVVAELAHALEALLDRIRGGAQRATTDIIDLLFAGTDALELAIERAVAGRGQEIDIAPLVHRLNAAVDDSAPAASADGGLVPDMSRLTDPLGVSTIPFVAATPHAARLPATSTEGRGPVSVRLVLAEGAPLPGVRAFMVLANARTLGEVRSIEPPPERLQDDAFDGTLRFDLDPDVSHADVDRSLRSVGDVAIVELTPHPGSWQPSILAPESAPSTALPGHFAPGPIPAPMAPPVASSAVPPTDAGRRDDGDGGGAPRRPSTSVGAPNGDDAGSRRQRHVRIDLRRLDALMNLIGELVITRGRLAQISATINDDALDEAVAQTARLVTDLQDEIMTSRMVPVWQIFDRFPRLVRDAARSLGKQVVLDVEGKDIELDRSLLDEIGDPIVHLLRNAIDHGIESPDDRAAAGKDAVGRLTLTAVRDRSAVIIRVSDDGRGIDRERVLRKAKERGDVDGSKTELTDDELIRLVSRPGFSTAERVTNISGRGVGVDAVQTRVRSLGGSVDIRTTAGIGTTVTVRLPLTLAIVRALLAKVGDEVYALPMTHVNETVELESALLRTVKGREVLVLRDAVLPLIRMRSLLQLPAVSDERRQVIVLEVADRRAGLIVDELTGQQEIVVKQFDGVRDGLPLFSGATILGDGAPALIVDVGSLI
jgi:two-component system chemotaxis sensor kinase CheA